MNKANVWELKYQLIFEGDLSINNCNPAGL